MSNAALICVVVIKRSAPFPLSNRRRCSRKRAKIPVLAMSRAILEIQKGKILKICCYGERMSDVTGMIYRRQQQAIQRNGEGNQHMVYQCSSGAVGWALPVQWGQVITWGIRWQVNNGIKHKNNNKCAHTVNNKLPAIPGK